MCLSHSQYASLVSVVFGIYFTMKVSGKKLFSCPRLIKRLMIEFVFQLKSNATVIFFHITWLEVLFPGLLT